MTDLVCLMVSLIDSSGKILVPGILDEVAPVTLEDDALYDGISFDCEAYKDEINVSSVSNKLLHEDKKKKDVLMAKWRFLTLSLHGIEVRWQIW